MKSPVTITIRKANENDFNFVVHLMDRALDSFYGGDHQAHAQRIFAAHINDNVDSVGQFSTGQYMFIAEINHHPAGMIHLVIKKQATVKISPILLASIMLGNSTVQWPPKTKPRSSFYCAKDFIWPAKRKIITSPASTSVCCISH